MATTGKKERRISDDEMGRLIALIKDSDSVELKLTVPTEEHRATIATLPLYRRGADR